jgi:hypothetical protein
LNISFSKDRTFPLQCPNIDGLSYNWECLRTQPACIEKTGTRAQKSF